MSDLKKEVEALKEQYIAAKEMPLYTPLDTEFSRIVLLNLLSQAFTLFDKALEELDTKAKEPLFKDFHFVGDDGIK